MSWDHHDVLDALPKYDMSNDCLTSAMLRSIAPYSENGSYAADVNTRTVICAMYLSINFQGSRYFITLLSWTWMGFLLYISAPLMNADNMFSSLVGLPFMWHLIPETDILPANLAHVPLKDSPFSVRGGLCGDEISYYKKVFSGERGAPEIYSTKLGFTQGLGSLFVLSYEWKDLKEEQNESCKVLEGMVKWHDGLCECNSGAAAAAAAAVEESWPKAYPNSIHLFDMLCKPLPTCSDELLQQISQPPHLQ
ncbi:LOW QUALITY PROTEIN: hypothetical protein RJ641_030375, partial [Dillenia turbinata]